MTIGRMRTHYVRRLVEALRQSGGDGAYEVDEREEEQQHVVVPLSPKDVDVEEEEEEEAVLPPRPPSGEEEDVLLLLRAVGHARPSAIELLWK